MSERMIELQRARLLAAGKGGNASSHHHQPSTPQNGSHHHQAGGQRTAASLGHYNSHHNAASIPGQLSPQQAAAASIRLEDTQMQRFLQRLQERDDSRSDATACPTVPTALSRRILHKQGAGYLDDTVAAVVSAGADRFLATVLQQAVACRDQRLKGIAIEREAARHRKRHKQQHLADADDRKRRKHEREQRRRKRNLADIQAAAALKKSGAAPTQQKDTTDDTKPKKKQKKTATENGTASRQANGNRKKKHTSDDDDEDSYDSLDEEEEYYQQFYGDTDSDVDYDDEEDDDDEMLILRDLARPLQAWDFSVKGKQGMDLMSSQAEENAYLSEDTDDPEALLDQSQEMGGGEATADDTAMNAAEDFNKGKRRSKSPIPNSA